MAHTFDSGLALPQRTLIRRALVAALADLRKPTKYLAAIGELPAPIVGDNAVDFLRAELAGKTPAVAIALGACDFEAVGAANTEWQGTLQVHVYAASTHGRKLVDGRTAADVVALASDTADPGLEVIEEHVRERLAGLRLSATRAAEARPSRVDLFFVDKDMTVMEMTFTVDVFATVNPARARTQSVVDIDTTHTETVAGAPSAVRTVTELDP